MGAHALLCLASNRSCTSCSGKLRQLRIHAGIPKFYRWLSERYPLLNQPTDVGETPLVDNLYLDMNGIIHNCTHGNDPGTKLTEEEMVVKIFTYLDKLFQVVKPQKLLFMAIDGKLACGSQCEPEFLVPCLYLEHCIQLLAYSVVCCPQSASKARIVPRFVRVFLFAYGSS